MTCAIATAAAAAASLLFGVEVDFRDGDSTALALKTILPAISSSA